MLSSQGCAEDVMIPLGSHLAPGLGVEATANVIVIATVLVVAIVVCLGKRGLRTKQCFTPSFLDSTRRPLPQLLCFK